MRTIEALMLALGFAALPGCGTIEAFKSNYSPYGGIRADVQVFGETRPCGDYLLRALDMPVSLVADTSIMGVFCVMAAPYLPLLLAAGLKELGVPPLPGPSTKRENPTDGDQGPGIVIDNRNYEGWKGTPFYSWRRFKSVMPSRTCLYTDRLVDRTPDCLLLERELDGQRYQVKVFARLKVTEDQLNQERQGDETLDIGGRPLSCHWVSWGSGEHGEKHWYSSQVVGGWVKSEYRNSSGWVTEDTLLEEGK